MWAPAKSSYARPSRRHTRPSAPALKPEILTLRQGEAMKDLIAQLHPPSRDIVHATGNRVEFWFARDLQPILGYAKWEAAPRLSKRPRPPAPTLVTRFPTIFLISGKWTLWKIGRSTRGSRTSPSPLRVLSHRAQNGDPSKDGRLGPNLFRGADPQAGADRRSGSRKLSGFPPEETLGIKRSNSPADHLRAVRATSRDLPHPQQGRPSAVRRHHHSQMKERLGVPGNRPLADFLPTITIKAKGLRQRNHQLQCSRRTASAPDRITQERVKNSGVCAAY